MGCQRTGMCCTLFYLPASPERLKELAEEYEKNPYEFQGIPARIDEMYRMVKDRVVGKVKDDPNNGYLYGPCENLFHTTDDNGKTIAGCKIQDNKPYTCVGYPNNYLDDSLKNNPNPSYYKDCGYNKDPEHGKTHADQLNTIE